MELVPLSNVANTSNSPGSSFEKVANTSDSHVLLPLPTPFGS